MPPKAKAKPDAASKKTVEKKKEKVIEDKTFGLKNKKGTKQQKFIQHVAQTVKYGAGKSAKEMDKLKEEKVSQKEKKKKELEELNALFKPVQDQKVAKGVDPKSVLCAFFKSGLCTKGDKCKFSHDLAIGRKAEKRSIYNDGDEAKKDSMEDWDEAKLEEVVNKRHGEKNQGMPATTIICKYFLDAVENSKYGWFWACPNGEGCHYKHALPSGFVLKKDKKKMDEQKMDEITLEELIEKERSALSSKNLTKVTLESFLKWKERKRKEKIAKAKQAADKKKQNFAAGHTLGISGREMFEFNPDLVVGDDAEADDVKYRPDDEDGEDDGPVVEINIEALSTQASEVDGTGTVSKPGERSTDPSSCQAAGNAMVNGASGDGQHSEDESGKLDMAGAIPDPALGPVLDDDGDAIAFDDAIDENLFDGEDLDLVEEELETLELVD